MFKIGDFSQIGQISVRMLRYYDNMGLLKPSHVDELSGYRYYTLDQLPRLNRIAALKDLGLTLQQITDLLAEDLPLERLQSMLKHKQEEIQSHLHEEMARLTRIATRLHQIEHENEPLHYDVALKLLSAQQLAAVRAIVPHLHLMGEFRNRMLRQLYAWLDAHSVTYAEEVVIYHLESYTESDIDMSIGVLLDAAVQQAIDNDASMTLHALPATPQAASIVHRGTIHSIADVVMSLYRWVGVNGYASAGPCREIHRFGRELDVCSGDPLPEVVFEILVPVEPL